MVDRTRGAPLPKNLLVVLGLELETIVDRTLGAPLSKHAMLGLLSEIDIGRLELAADGAVFSGESRVVLSEFLHVLVEGGQA